MPILKVPMLSQKILPHKERQLRHTTDAPGVARLEAYRWSWVCWRGWIFSNPITGLLCVTVPAARHSG